MVLGLGIWLSAWALPALAEDNADTADSTSLQTNPAPAARLIPLPIIFYQPETGTGFGASVVYLFTLGEGKAGRQLLRSSISATAIYTTKQQIITTVGAETYPNGGRYRTLANLIFERFPTSLWGIGNDTPESLKEDYTPDRVAASGEFSVEVAPHMYAGLFGQGGNRRLREFEAGGLIATRAVPGTEDGTLVTLGLLLTRDSRSSNMYPRSGEYHQLRISRSLDVSGHDNDFSALSLDLRAYVPIRSGVMALRALGVASGEVPPFDLMPRLGGESLLRGYFGGRFRDRSLSAFEAEVRSGMWRRMRGVVFAGAGQVADVPGDMRWDAFHPSAGFGLRFLLNRAEEFNLRADFGFGFDVESSGFYLGFGEAF
jgi:outer membrane protein assembly factor BamA